MWRQHSRQVTTCARARARNLVQIAAHTILLRHIRTQSREYKEAEPSQHRADRVIVRCKTTANMKLTRVALCACLCAAASLAAFAASTAEPQQAAAPGDQQQQEESYQRIYETFSKLVQNVSNNSLNNARRLVSRLQQLVGTPSESVAATPDEKTEQILKRLDTVTKDTDQNTLTQLNDDVGRLVGSLNESYLRNIRRVIERVNKMVGTSSPLTVPPSPPQQPQQLNNKQQPTVVLHQNGDRLDDPGTRGPGFPGWDELIVSVDRIQKSLAHFVRSSTRLITSG